MHQFIEPRNCLVAGVRLPDGATVSSIFFYLRDASAGDVTISLRRKRIDDESVSSAMGTVTTSGTGAGVRIFSDVSITNGVVDNSSYTYYVSTDTCLDTYEYSLSRSRKRSNSAGCANTRTLMGASSFCRICRV